MKTPSFLGPEDRRLTLSLVIMFLLAIGLFIYGDAQARGVFSKVDTPMEKIKRDAIEPAGGVEIKGQAIAHGDKGALSVLECTFDTQCPYISRTWLAPVAKGEEGELVKNALEKEGYSITFKNFSDCPKLDEGSSLGLWR